MSTTEHMNSRTILPALAGWLCVAVIAGASGIFALLKPPLPQIILFGLTAVLLLIFRLSPAFRHWLFEVDIRVLLLVHLSRFVGIYFLLLYSRGELPFAFAVPGGWGDIGAATIAFLLLIYSTVTARFSRTAYLLWNLLGTLDIFMVVLTAARLALKDPQSMTALMRLPLSLLPTFIVPLIIFTHVIIFLRFLKRQRRSPQILTS